MEAAAGARSGVAANDVGVTVVTVCGHDAQSPQVQRASLALIAAGAAVFIISTIAGQQGLAAVGSAAGPVDSSAEALGSLLPDDLDRLWPTPAMGKAAFLSAVGAQLLLFSGRQPGYWCAESPNWFASAQRPAA